MEKNKSEEIQTLPPENSGGLSRFITAAWCLKPTAFIGAASIAAAVALIFSFFPKLLSTTGWGEDQWVVYPWTYFVVAALCCGLCFVTLRLHPFIRRGLEWAFVLVLPLFTFWAVDIINGTRLSTFDFKTKLANYLCYLLVYVLMFALFRKAFLVVISGGLICLVFGIANYFTASFRGAPILPWDLQTVGTAMTVLDGYKFYPTPMMVLSLLGLLLAALLALKLCGGKETRKAAWIQHGVGAVGALVLYVLLLPMNLLSNQLDISVWAWNQKISSELTGIGAGFFGNLQYMLVEKPKGYSPERVEELLAETQEKEASPVLGKPEKLPTVVVIMNESFTDMEKTGNGTVSFEPDPLAYIHDLEKSGKIISGTAYSSVYGGNTCNSEYEFLTGNTTAFLPVGSKPYQQYLDGSQVGLPSLLKSYGYDCVAIHPGQRTAWQRDIAYPYLGFDRFVDVRAFNVNRTLEHGMTSDKSHYDQLLYEYANKGEKPLFLFTVTIQNHSGYTDEAFPTTVQVKEAPGKYPEAEQYLSLLKKSDEALEDLLTYFEQQEDPVVVLFFGDHWPDLEEGFTSMLLGADSNNLSPEDSMRQYEVPYFLWANYPIEGQDMGGLSMNYLSGLLTRAAGLSDTPYQQFAEGLRETLPVITALGMIDYKGNLYENGEETPYDELLNDYAILQYNSAFDRKNQLEELFMPDKGETP